ncbi:hypothetical protein BGZ76_003942 [Entomortierella beljakovae]|nr:hypothetical protein BGZ76_003942 [Entomortierella beljakovae]
MLEGYIPTPSGALGEVRKAFPSYLEGFGKPEVGLTLEKALNSLKDPVEITITDTLGEARDGFPGYLEGFGQPEVGLTLDQFSMQLTLAEEWSDEEFNNRLGLASFPNARKMVEFFGPKVFGEVVEYQGIFGYDPKRICQSELSYCNPLDFKRPPSELFKAHNMGMYGSGGLPKRPREGLKSEWINSAVMIESNARQYSHQASVEGFHGRPVSFGRLAWCRAARAIQVCWRVSTTLDRDWGGWLLKIAVHAACTLERVRSEALESSLAAITLIQLSREIAYGLQWMVCDSPGSTEMAAVAAMLTDAGFGFINTGLCLILSQQLDEEHTSVLFGLAIESKTHFFGTFRLTPNRMELVQSCIKSTNFCASQHIMTTVERHSRVMLHLVARAKYLTTSRKLHRTCGNTCEKAINVDNHQQVGHIDEKCECKARYFKPIETTDLVLFDTEMQKLEKAKPGAHYVAVSQVWFQGIFGQSSRKCGECTLRYLRMACVSLGVRYAWIDTLCMPTGKSLRQKVITKLRDIYLNAGATLVIDVGLRWTKARTVLDLSFAIFLSDWSSRIWTLQEGVLASKLLFCVGEQVLALPQMRLSELLDTQNMVTSRILGMYGMREFGLDQPLQTVLALACGRQTSHSCDYLFGLSAMLPSTPTNREENLELIAIEVARMYKSIDLGILQIPLDRCKTDGYRWMPLKAKTMTKEFDTGISAFISERGLKCPVTALLKLTSVTDINVAKSQLWEAAGTVQLNINIKFWYSTEVAGVFVGTCVVADHSVYCLVGHSDHDRSHGFVVSPTTDRGIYQYLGEAASIGMVAAQHEWILVT